MAKRAPQDEKPFRPLDMSLLSAVVRHTGAGVRVEEAKEERRESASNREWGSEHRPPVSLMPPQVSRLDQEKRVLYTRQERQALDRLVNNLAVRLNAQVKLSHVMRALTTLFLHAENQIDKRAGEHGPMTRPPNGDFAALQRFERTIATIVAQAIRDAGIPS